MNDRERTFLPRAEFDLLKERIDKLEGSGKGMRELWGWIAAGIMVLVTLLNLWATK